MGAVAAYTGRLNPATLARFASQYQNAMGEWNGGAQTIGASQAIATLHRLTRGRTRVETIALASCRITYTGHVGADSGASPKLGRSLAFARWGSRWRVMRHLWRGDGLTYVALHIVKCYRVVSRAIRRNRFLSQSPSRPRCERVFALAPRLTTRPPRCFVRVVSLGGWCGVQRRGRDGQPATNASERRRGTGEDQTEEPNSGSTATTRAQARQVREGCGASSTEAGRSSGAREGRGAGRAL